jgi:hypothetical protein
MNKALGLSFKEGKYTFLPFPPPQYKYLSTVTTLAIPTIAL